MEGCKCASPGVHWMKCESLYASPPVKRVGLAESRVHHLGVVWAPRVSSLKLRDLQAPWYYRRYAVSVTIHVVELYQSA